MYNSVDRLIGLVSRGDVDLAERCTTEESIVYRNAVNHRSVYGISGEINFSKTGGERNAVKLCTACKRSCGNCEILLCT